MNNTRWERLKWRNGERSKDEAEQNTVKILIQLITSELKKKLGLRDDQAPSQRDLVDDGHGDFISAIKRYGLKFSVIVKKANLKLKKPTRKWNLNFNLAVEILIRFSKSLRHKRYFSLENGKVP